MLKLLVHLAALALSTVLLAALSVQDANAHDLVLDQLWMRVEENAPSLSGQLLLDPELGREGKKGPDARKQLLAFVEKHVLLESDGVLIDCRWSIRELWTKGGAVSADLLVFSATRENPEAPLSVRLGPEIPSLVATVEIQSPGKSPPRSYSTLLLAGQRTAPFFLGNAEQTWQEGGPELFEPPPETPLAGLDAPQAISPPPGSGSRPTLDARPEAAPETPGKERLRSAWNFFVLGVMHIIPHGWDHVAFVLALALGARSVRVLLVELSVFTTAHTLTLAIGSLQIITLHARLVEPLIALSVAWAGLENLMSTRGSTEHPKARVPLRHLTIILLFGLLHGLGFAGVLKELALPGASFLSALLSFNVGLEVGQIIVASGALMSLLALRRWPGAQRLSMLGVSLLVTLVGLYWTIERSIAS